MTIAAVIAVHSDAPYLQPTLASIHAQESPVDERIAVIDSVTDEVRDLLDSYEFSVQLSTTTATDTHTRIAQNFMQGVRAAHVYRCDVTVLGDHDDIWRTDRVLHHRFQATQYPNADMYASNGAIINAIGIPTRRTLQDTFTIPSDWSSRSRNAQFTYALRHSIATGGASAIRTEFAIAHPIPTGWLHDRWWSLAAIRGGGMVVDHTVVIDYRISDEQQVGLDTQHQDSGAKWWRSKIVDTPSSIKRSWQLRTLR